MSRLEYIQDGSNIRLFKIGELDSIIAKADLLGIEINGHISKIVTDRVVTYIMSKELSSVLKELDREEFKGSYIDVIVANTMDEVSEYTASKFKDSLIEEFNKRNAIVGYIKVNVNIVYKGYVVYHKNNGSIYTDFSDNKVVGSLYNDFNTNKIVKSLTVSEMGAYIKVLNIMGNKSIYNGIGTENWFDTSYSDIEDIIVERMKLCMGYIDEERVLENMRIVASTMSINNARDNLKRVSSDEEADR